MKKKSILLFSSFFVVFGLVQPKSFFSVGAENPEPTTAEKLHDLFASFKGKGDFYTKKTTIALNDDAVNEMSTCFHCNETASKRTTYYTRNKLLLALEDGSIPEGSGSYQYVDGEVKRAAALAGSDEFNMWTNLSEPVSVGHINATKLEDYYKTLDTFLVDGYFDNWNENNDVYYYDLTNEDKTKNEEFIYNCPVWNDFLYFCAPMIYMNSGKYLSAKSLTVTTKYDNNGILYLCLDMYLADGDSYKLNQPYLAEARIYKGNNIFQENLDKAFFLFNSTSHAKTKMESDPDNNKHLMLKNVDMTKGDAVKVWDTLNNYHGVSQNVEHNLSIDINADTGFKDAEDNYVIPEDGKYDFYIDFNDDGSYKKLYVEDKSAMTIYVSDGGWSDIDGSRMWARYFDANDVEITTDSTKPRFVDSHKNEYDQQVHKITIPGEAKYIQICYNKTDNDYVITKKLEIKYEEYNGFYFDQWNGGGDNITFGTWNYPADRV